MSDNDTSINPRQQILHSEDSEPTGKTVEMPQGIDDFTIVLPELTDMAACDLKVYEGLDRLWRMVERYKMTAPIAIRVVDNKARCVRAIRGTRYQASGWQLEDETTAVAPRPGGEVEFPLTINVQDAKRNILKMRLQLGVPKPGLSSNHSHDRSNGPVAVYVHGTAQLSIASRPNRASDHPHSFMTQVKGRALVWAFSKE